MRDCVVRSAIIAAVCCLSIGLVRAQSQQQEQAPPTDKAQMPVMSQDAFKNVQLLRGIPVKEFMDTMGFFAAATGLNCSQCHVEESGGNWAKYADDNELKQTTRKMIVMMNTINQSFFSGRPVVSCVSCHRGSTRPTVTPNLADQYGESRPTEPDEIAQAPDAPDIDQVLNKYLQAIGGAQRLANVASFIAKGTYQGYDDFDQYPLEIYAKAPEQLTTVVHGANGEARTVYDGRAGWILAPIIATPVPLLELTGGELDAAKVVADLFFPGRIKQLLTEWRVGVPASFEGRDLQVVQGRLRPGALPVRLYFDMESGLLVRLVCYSETPMGRVPIQVDYQDYRDVGGIKMPFKWITTWTDGRSISELSSVQLNASIETARFAKPLVPASASR